MDVRVLGALEVSRAGMVVAIGGARKPRLLLAALLSQAGQVVSVDRLVDVVWAGPPPASARPNVQHYIHRLRTTLGSERIERVPGGYVIHVGDEFDALRFRRLAAEGTAALIDGDAVRAGHRLREALHLWRGPAYAEFADCPAIAAEAVRLEELRVAVYEHWAEAELRLGRSGVPVAALTDLVRAHPFRESLRGYLMRSLYGAGRRADALELFRDTRAMFAEQLGVEPAPQLHRLHESMLRGEAQLAGHAHPL